MIDIEQRAHDLALLYMQMEVNEGKIKSSDDDTFEDFVNEYRRCRDNIIEQFG